MDSKLKKAVLYARVSSDKQDTDLSISAQLRAIREYADRNGYTIFREFIDEAESGRTAARPAFREMIALARTKNPSFSVILVWKLNRFARNRADSITYKTLLRNKGIEVISINEPVDNSPTGRLLEGVIESIDEFYSANLGQDIRRGMRENASRGFFNGSRPPYGYHRIQVKDGDRMRNRLAPDSEDSVAVQTVRRIFDMAAKDLGCKEIAKTLNREGLRTSTGQRWGRTTVYKILSNEAYIGTLVWGSGKDGHSASRSETPIRVENAWPALIDPQVFYLVQKKMAGKRPQVIHPRTVPSFYLLSGIMFCSCGYAMIGHSAKSGRHFYYLCSRGFKQGKDACNTRMLPKEKLERQVLAELRTRVLTDENMEELVRITNEELQSAADELKERIDIVEAELRDMRARLARLYDALETGKVDLDDLSPRIKELKARLTDLEKSQANIEAELASKGIQPLNVDLIKKHARDLRQLLVESSLTERKAFLRSFIRRIETDGKQVTIHYKLPLVQGTDGWQDVAVLPIDTSGGADGIRTRYLYTASVTFSQVNYGPITPHIIYQKTS